MRLKRGKNYELEAKVEQYGPDAFSFELHQLFPEAQRPRWQRLIQLNLTQEEAHDLGRLLLNTKGSK